MFEPHFDQAHGLQALVPVPPTRVLPVVATEGDTLSLELLWTLERELQAQGHTLVVIDGLRGLQPQDAAQGHQRVLQRWLAGVPQGVVVLLHAQLHPLAVLLADSEASPLVPIASPTSRHDRRCSRAARTASASSRSAESRRQAASLTAMTGGIGASWSPGLGS